MAFYLKYLGRLPIFKYSVYRDNNSLYKKKQYLRKKKGNVGHAFEEKIVCISFLKWKLLEFNLTEGEELTAEHFFLNRPIIDVEYLLEISKEYIKIDQSSLIFDPGCGTGRHLFYLADKYDCYGVGVDVYAPAIAIAQKVNLGKRIRFYNCSSLEDGLLDKIIPNGCEYVFINSWLNHVYKYDGYDGFIDKLLSSCRYILLISSLKFELEEFFPNPEVIIEKKHEKLNGEVRYGTRYAVIKGKK